MSSTSRVRRSIAIVAAAGLSVLGLAAVAAPASADTPTQPLTWTVGTPDGAPMYAGGSGGVLNFKITNPVTNNKAKKLKTFTVVIPAAAGTPTPGSVTGNVVALSGKSAGVSGPGNWTETIKPCGTVPDCAGILVVTAAAPTNRSGIAPGQSVTAALSITAPTATSLVFRVINCDDDYYVTPPTQSFEVLPGDAADYGVSIDGVTSTWTAGDTHTVRLSALAVNGDPSPNAAGIVSFSLGTDDPQASVTLPAADGTFVSAVADGQGLKQYKFDLVAKPAPATYDFTVVLKTKAQADVITIAKDATPVTGFSTDFDVIPALAAFINVGPAVDGSSAAPFPSGDTVTIPVQVTDSWGNVIVLSDSDVSIGKTSGSTEKGTWTRSLTPAVFNTVTGSLDVQGTATLAGTFPFTATYTGPSVLSPSPLSADGVTSFTFGAPANLTVTTLTDLTTANAFNVGDTINLDFTVTDAAGNAVTGLTAGQFNIMSSPTSGQFFQTGFSTPATGGYRYEGNYLKAENAILTVGLTSPALSGSIPQLFTALPNSTTKVFAAGAGGGGAIGTSNLSAGGNSCTSGTICGTGGLGNGASGVVTISAQGDTINLNGNFKNADGSPLYTPGAPAKFTVVCPIAVCPLNLAYSAKGTPAIFSSSDDKVSNSSVVGTKCTNSGIILKDIALAGGYKYCIYNTWEESIEYAKNFRVYATDGSGTNYLVQACQKSGTGSYDITTFNENSRTPLLFNGVMTNPGTAGNPPHTCLDVAKATRDIGAVGAPGSGDLTFVLFFYDDQLIKVPAR